MAKKSKNKRNTLEMMTALAIESLKKPKEVSEILNRKFPAKMLPPSMEWLLMHMDLDRALPENGKLTQEDRELFSRIVENIKVYRTVQKLSPEQLEVLNMLLKNPACSNQDIADKLGKKPKAVNAKMEKLLKKFGCYTRADLITKVLLNPPFNAVVAAKLMRAFFVKGKFAILAAGSDDFSYLYMYR